MSDLALAADVRLGASHDHPLLMARYMPHGQHFNASALLSLEQTNTLEVVALSFASVSVMAALCGIYWFLRMRRIFRRDLILLLILGDLWKSIWFGTNAAVTLSLGRPDENSAFCQVSGYLLFTGIEACDWAIFFQALHMMLQVFPPRNALIGSDGLYRVRRWVLAAWLVLPNVSASLAFVGSRYPYVSQGGFCTLPIRPIWYRIALSWAPRYLIVLFTLGVAIRIYRHVGFGFQVFRAVKEESTAAASAGETTLVPASLFTAAESTNVDNRLIESEPETVPDEEKMLSLAPNTVSPGRARPKLPPLRWPAGAGTDPIQPENPAPSLSGSSFSQTHTTHINDAADAPLQELDPAQFGRKGTSASWSSSKASSRTESVEKPGAIVPSAPAAPSQKPSKRHRAAYNAQSEMAARAMVQRRQAIQRQLRLLFIYPVVYLMLWVIPFVSHAMNYSNYYAQHPNFALRVLNIFIQCSMGTFDVAIFCWREKPWRHIPGTDGSFLGSFGLMKERRDSVVGQANPPSRTFATRLRAYVTRLDPASTAAPTSSPLADPPRRLSNAGKYTPHRHRHYPSMSNPRSPLARSFGMSDRRAMEVDAAHDRLRLERLDREKRRLQQSQQASGSSTPAATGGRTGTMTPADAASLHATSPTGVVPPTGTGRKEWWESRLMSVDDEGA